MGSGPPGNRLAESIQWNRFLGSIKVLKIPPLFVFIGFFCYTIKGTKTNQSICSSTIEGTKTKPSICSSTIKGTKTNQSICSSTIKRNEDQAKYLFLNYRRNEDEEKYSFLNYRWFDIASTPRQSVCSLGASMTSLYAGVVFIPSVRDYEFSYWTHITYSSSVPYIFHRRENLT